MAHARSHQQPSQDPGRSAFGRAVVWLLVAVSAIRGLRRGPDAGQHHAPPAAGAPATGAVRHDGSTGAAQSTGSDGGGTSDTDATRPGEQAGAPTQIPPAGWWQVIRRAFSESTSDNVGILAAGVAFFAFLAIPPALIAGLTLYGIVADPQTVAHQMQTLAGSLPREAQPLISDQLNTLAGGGNGALSIGLVISVLAALWSASTGTSNLMAAINLAYDQQESRGFLKLRAIALALTLGAIVFLLLTLFLVAVVPPLLQALQLGIIGTILAQILRWALLVGLVISALAIVYRLAPDRNAPKFAWTSPGALTATVLWVLGSIGFSLYVNNFGSYNKTYGTLAGVIVFLLWLYLTSYIILLGAEINAESEKQTAVDTTVGEPLPIGHRDAVAADTLAEPTNPSRRSR
jgi:membrane protein